MKKVYLIALLSLIVGSASAQTFQWITNDSVVENLDLNTTVQFPMYQTAIGTDTVTLGVEVIYNDIPATWDGMLCIYGTCLGTIPVVGTVAQMDQIYDSIEGMVRITINPMNGTEVAKFQAYVYDIDYPNDGDTATWIFNTTLGVMQMDYSEQIELYPNPVSSVLHVDAPFNTSGISVYSIAGDLLITESTTNEINVEALPAGAYIIQLNTDSGIVRKRFTKQ